MEELEQPDYLDPLTGVGNRRFAEQVITQRLSELERNARRFGICFFDINHFNQVKDRFGHDAGDAVLKTVAESVLGVVRARDLVARWEGEKFIVVLSQKNDTDLKIVAERIRKIVAAAQVGPDAIQVTISLGVTPALATDSLLSLVTRGDELMYHSKNRGQEHTTHGEATHGEATPGEATPPSTK